MALRFNEIQKWGIRLNGSPGILYVSDDQFAGFVGATFFTREAAGEAVRDGGIDGEVVPVLLLVIEVDKAEADADYRYYKTIADRAAGFHLSGVEFHERIINSLRKRIALLQEELEVRLAELEKLNGA